jgi:molecular chaperone IbpA
MAYVFGRNVLLNSVGFERLIDAFQQLETGDPASRAQTYPPYNIVKQSENNYLVEVAVAGFQQEDIEITVEGSKLSIVGKVKDANRGEYLHKGIATRDFSHQFTLAETVLVRAADMLNGLLVIRLENVIPDEKLPRKILIGGTGKHVVDERLAA